MSEDIQGGLVLPKKVGWGALLLLAGFLGHAGLLHKTVFANEKMIKKDNRTIESMRVATCGMCNRLLGDKDHRCKGVCRDPYSAHE